MAGRAVAEAGSWGSSHLLLEPVSREGSLLAQAAGSMERTSLEGMPILKNAPEPEREEPGRNVGIWFPRKPAWKIHWSDTPAAQRIPALAPGASGVRTLERASCQPF